MLSFKGRTALITGATGALGKIYATDLAKRGCNLFLNDMVGTPLGIAFKKLVYQIAVIVLILLLLQIRLRQSSRDWESM